MDTLDRRMAVCLVDDDEIMRDLLLRQLSRLECDTTTAVDPQDALETIASQSFDVVITDLYMPNVEDGLDFLSTLTELYPTLPVAVMSGEMSQSTQDTLTAAGAFACLEKPLNSQDVGSVLNKIVLSNGDSKLRKSA